MNYKFCMDSKLQRFRIRMLLTENMPAAANPDIGAVKIQALTMVLVPPHRTTIVWQFP